MEVVAWWTSGHADALRQALRMTNEAFAGHLGVAVRTVAYWRKRPDIVPQPALQETLDAALARASDREKAHFRLLLGGNSQPPSAVRGQHPVALDVPAITSWITATDTSDSAIDQLARATVAVAEAHTQSPAQRVLDDVLRLHREAQTLLCGGKLRLSQSRELFRIDSDLLAHACLLLGDLSQNDTAISHGALALLFAQESGASQARALSVQAKTARWQGRYAESADLASHGFIHSPRAPIRVQLAYQEANAAALLGDGSRARQALRRAEEVAEEADIPSDSGISAWSFPPARQAVFALSVATHIGDYDGALQAAAAADTHWATGEPQVPATWAQVRVGVGIAHLMDNALDGTVEEVRPVLDLPPELRMATVTGYMVNLDRRLRHRRFDNSKIAVELRDQIREFNSAALPDEEPWESR